ncbi:MAG: hypothetical protein AAGI71_07495 [Bacteroidota bacterium]
MSTYLHRFLRTLPLLLVAVLLSACGDLLNDDADTGTLSDEEAEVLVQVVADAVAEQPEGLMADVYDVTGEVGPDGILYMDEERPGPGGRLPRLANPERPWRGGQGDFEKTYDPATGTHTISYTRAAEHRGLSKSVEALLQYVYTDADGGFIEAPREDRDQVATVDFNGTRSGEVSGTRGREGQLEVNSSFSKNAAWNLTGVNTGTMLLVGSQNRSGTYDVTSADSTKNRTFTLSLNTDGLTIVPGDREAGTETVVTGTITYELFVEKTVNGVTEITEDAGTVELTGDEEGRIRLLGFNRLFRVNLRTGDVDRDGSAS